MPPWATSRCASTLILSHALCPTCFVKAFCAELQALQAMYGLWEHARLHSASTQDLPCGNLACLSCQNHIIAARCRATAGASALMDSDRAVCATLRPGER